MVNTKKSRPLGEIRRRASISYSGCPLRACSETVIELKCMRTIKLEPGFSGSSFRFCTPLTENALALETSAILVSGDCKPHTVGENKNLEPEYPDAQFDCPHRSKFDSGF